MFTSYRVIPAALLMLGITGCAGHGQAAPGIIPEVVTTLQVRNDNPADMIIYVYSGGQRLRLGRANGQTITALKIPRNLMLGLTELRFEAVPTAGPGRSVSEKITVSPGEDVTLVIPPL